MPPSRPERLGALAAGLALIAVIGYGLPLSAAGPDRAAIAVRDVRSGPERAVSATIEVTPPDAVAEPEFLNVTAWQGGGSVVDPLERVAPGVYRTTRPIPVHGGWKAMLRLQKGDVLVSVPIFLPEDRGIPAPEVPARASFTREFQLDREILQRERKEGVPGWVSVSGYLTTLALALSLATLLAWTLMRLEGGRSARAPRTRAAERRGAAA